MRQPTKEDMIRYLYNELTTEEASSIKNAIESDPQLKDTFDSLIASHVDLGNLNYSPEQSTIEKIMNYAKQRFS